MNIFVVKGPMTERPPNQVHGLCCLFDLGRSRSAQLRSIKGNQDLETFRAHTVLASEDLKKLVDQSFVWASVTKGNLVAWSAVTADGLGVISIAFIFRMPSWATSQSFSCS